MKFFIFFILPPGPEHSCSVGHTSIRSHCSALFSVALAKCQCWDLGLLILLLNVAALSGKKDWIDLWTKRCFREWESCLNLAMSRHVPLANPRSPRTLWSQRMALDYISGTATLYEVFLWNSLYCLTTSTWALGLRGRGGGFLHEWRCVVLVKHGWNLKKFFSLFNPFKL